MKQIRSFIKNKSWLMIAVVILLTLFLSGPGFAMPNDSGGTIVLLGNENLAPIVYNDNGTAKGVAVDIAKAMGNRTGYDIQVRTTNWEQAQMMVSNGEADGLLQINPNPARDNLYDFSEPLLKSEFSMFVRSGNTTIKSIDDLKGRRVGVEAGGYPHLLLQKYEAIELEKINDWKISFERLSDGDLDVLIVDRWIGEYELAQSRITGIGIVEEPIETQYSRIAVRKGDTETLALINAGLKEITEDGTVDKILEQWQGKRVIYVTEDYFKIFFLHSAIFVLLLVALVAIYFVAKYHKLSKKLEARVQERTEELYQANEMLKAANFELEQISMIDGLTSIENRRAFDTAYDRTWKICLREKMPLALIMLDIDNFKLFNDTYGHLSGDQILMKIAGAIKDVINRPGDLAARYGGDEFIVMLLNTTAEGAAVVAEKIRTRIEELGTENRAMKVNVTASIGVAAVVPDARMEPADLIDAVDKALYQAKEAGRNRVTVWQQQSLL